jgi:anti-sigma regulatory factor (Ser/Thr protein kinase)
LKKDIIHRQVRYQWESVHDVHDEISKLCRDKGLKPLEANALTMAATELMENAVKYGRSLPNFQCIDFLLSQEDEETILISVSNGTTANTHVQQALEYIKRLHEVGDSKKLYTERIMQLMNGPECKSGQLGLLRIAYEGSFSIDYKYENEILTIIARRHLLDFWY